MSTNTNIFFLYFVGRAKSVKIQLGSETRSSCYILLELIPVKDYILIRRVCWVLKIGMIKQPIAKPSLMIYCNDSGVYCRDTWVPISPKVVRDGRVRVHLLWGWCPTLSTLYCSHEICANVIYLICFLSLVIQLSLEEENVHNFHLCSLNGIKTFVFITAMSLFHQAIIMNVIEEQWDLFK